MITFIRNSRYFFAKEKQRMVDAFKHFLEHDAGASVRQAPHQKDRKYAHVEIAEEFKKHEQARKQKRLEHMIARKKLLQHKITTQSKLLTSQQNQELSQLTQEISSLQSLLQQQQKELAVIDSKLQETEADLILIEGPKKLIILNKIQYLKHMNYHPSGLLLHPEVMKMIENVHYLVNNNLPVNKYKLFELMPEIFQTEINELEESMRRLIQEKKLDPESDPSTRIRFFTRHKKRFRDPEQDIIDLQKQKQAVFENMEKEIRRLGKQHEHYIKMVIQGATPFRNTYHLISVMLSDTINLKLSEEEEALRKTIHQVVELKQKFQIYNEDVNNRVIKMRYKYIQPPEWIKKHPVLLERYEKIMVRYTNPEPIADSLPDSKPDDGGRAYLEEKLKNLVIEKYHPLVEKLWSEGKRDELIATKKQLQIDFYNDSTKIYEEYQEMIAEQLQKEEFLKIAKKPRQIQQQRHTRISLDELTKSIMVNNSNPGKYNLSFFTKFLGLETEEETRKLFNSFSYLRVPVQEEKTIENLQFDIIKFKV